MGFSIPGSRASMSELFAGSLPSKKEEKKSSSREPRKL